MKVDFAQPIRDLGGQPLSEGGNTLTLGTVCINSLLVTLMTGHGPEQLDGTAKVTHATLAQTIHTAEAAVDLKAEDIALLKDRVGRACIPIVVMRAWALLDPPGGD